MINTLSIVQKGISRYKEWKLTHNVQMNLPNLEPLEQPSTEEDVDQQPVTCSYNNSKYNVAIFNGKEIFFIGTFFFGIGLIFNYIEHPDQDENGMDLYRWMVFREFFFTLCKLFMNLYYIVMKKVVRDFIWNEFCG